MESLQFHPLITKIPIKIVKYDIERGRIIVKDLGSKDYDILESKKEIVIIISNGMACHECLINLNKYFAVNFDLSFYSYNLVYEDNNSIPERRLVKELYLKEFVPNIQNIYFMSESLIIQKRLNINNKIFHQSTPYVVYIDSNKKALYFSYELIFNIDGTVKKSFKIK